MHAAREYGLSMLLLCACSSETPSAEADAAIPIDTGPATGGAGGAAGASGGMGGASGAMGGAGGNVGGAAGTGNGGATGGRAGSIDAGGSAGSSSGGRAGNAGGNQDAATDRADGSRDASGLDRDDETRIDIASDSRDAPDELDATFDNGVQPSDADACSPLPAAGVYATFRVVNDVFRASITHPTGIDQALALWVGQSQAKIPVGQLECGNGTYNCGWTWRMSPSTITFAELTIEVCDATPSYVQGNCASFPNGTYCPWSAELIELRDCRTQTSCPAVPR